MISRRRFLHRIALGFAGAATCAAMRWSGTGIEALAAISEPSVIVGRGRVYETIADAFEAGVRNVFLSPGETVAESGAVMLHTGEHRIQIPAGSTWEPNGFSGGGDGSTLKIEGDDWGESRIQWAGK